MKAGLPSERRAFVLTENQGLGAAFLLAFLVVVAIHALDFYGSVPDFRKRSGGGTLLDIKPALSEAELYRRLSDYGVDGRKVYAFRNRTVDVVLPLGVLPFLVLFMLKASRAVRAGRLPQALLLSLPFTYVVFDFAENAAVLALLARYPERDPSLALVLPYLTLIKRAASILALVVPAAILSVGFLRRRMTRRPVAVLALLLIASATEATAASPEGRWSTIDDRSGEVRSVVRLQIEDGELRGFVEKIVPRAGDPTDPHCTRCSGARRNQRVTGMQILEGYRRDGDRWTGGRVLDPENGKEYSSSVWLDGPDRLRVRGYWGLFYRTQTWHRVSDDEGE